MKCFQRLLILFVFCSFLTASAQDQCKPVGWATQNGGTTGGGSATPVTVTTLADLKTQANSSTAKVIYVSGTMGTGVSTRVPIAANKTIIGLPGAKLIGGFDVNGSNVIIRNMKVQGPGSVDVDGVDCITVDGATNVWIDHCDIYDGQDGNLDIVNGANYVAVTWCKFSYTAASSNHQFCNLIGNSDTKTSDRGKLRITMMYNWWTVGCKERMPRVRFGQVHVINNLFDSKQASYCVRAGVEANILVESNYFDAVKIPIDLYQNNFTAVTSKNNVFNATSGNTAGSGTAFTPPYVLTITPAASVKAMVANTTCGAGATLASPTSCGCGTSSTFTLTTASSPAAGGSVTGAGTYNSGAVATVTATPASGYVFSSWSGDASGTSASTAVTMNSNKSATANFQAAPNLLSIAFNTAATTSLLQPPYVSGVINDPTDPAKTKGIIVDVKDNGVAIPAANYTISGASSTTSVVGNANIAITKSDGQADIRLTPSAVGYTTITITLTKGPNTKSITINYAASSASSTPATTNWLTGISDGSAAIALDDNYFVVADDELNKLYVHSRSQSGLPYKSYNYAGNLSLPDGTAEEVDLEGAVRSTTISGRVYWIGSMGNGKSPNFSSKPNRNRIFATTVSGTGAATAFSFNGYYGSLKQSVITWGDANGYNFTASAAAGHDSKVIDGFNVEGLTFGPDNSTLYIGMRAPLVPVGNRTNAVIVPVLNFESWFNNGAPSGNPTLGSPIQLNLGGRGIRDLVRLSNGTYIVVAGSYDDAQNGALYRWTGNASDAPVALSSFNTAALNMESVMGVNESGALSLTKLQGISDNGSTIFYNDAIEAKDLAQNNFKKYRSDILTGNLAVTYSLTTNANPVAGGSVSGSGTYNSGTVVTVTATPAAGYTFVNWSGDASGTNATTTVTMNSNKSVSANFQLSAPTTYTLSTSASPAAGGTVSGAGSYNSGAVVTVTATPAAGYTFVNWSGDASGTNATTTVTMNSNKSVTANFQLSAPTTYTLSTSASPAAGGAVSGAGSYNSGTVVTVSATPAAGYTFVNWSGDASGTNATTTVTMSANKSVTANFQVTAPTTYTLTTAASPVAGGTVSGAGSYNSGTVVTVTATPAAGYTFVNWAGDASGTNATTTVTMSANKSVTANFQVTPPATYTLTTAANPAAAGTITGAGTYNSGDVATVTATPTAGFTFVNWSGDATGTSTTTTVTMNANKSVTANFQSTSGGTYTIRIEDNATPSTGLCSYDGVISSNSGANNGKVINLTNSTAKAINWKVNAASAGSYTLNWRYVNSSSSNAYTMKLVVNGVTINAALPFPKTSGSSVFSNTTIAVSLFAGNNDVRLETTVAVATADIDWLEITGDNPVAGNCLAAKGPAIVMSNNTDARQKTGVFPNPAKGNVTIGFYLPVADQITIKLFDANNRMIDRPINRLFTGGYHQVIYNVAGRRPGFYTVAVAGSQKILEAYKLIVR
jgi:uncharacterized repeat protein (TIGR02543 family)